MTSRNGPTETPDSEEWLDRLAVELGDQPLNSREVDQVLKLARDVAHGVERKLAPLAAFLAGAHVGRRTAAGISPDEALAEAVRTAAALLPKQPSPEPPDSPGGE